MSHKTVYVVDDDPDVSASLAFFLEAANFTARTFGEAQTFVATSACLSPGCVLLDIRMPGIDGFEVLERLKLGRPILPVVVMTGHGDVFTAVRAMKLGAIDFLEKPFEEKMLLEILSRAFDNLDFAVRGLERRRSAADRIHSLTDREREVLIALLGGRPNKVIAYELDISVRTVEMHRAAMMDRLGVRTFADALRLALDGGIQIDEVTIPVLPERRRRLQ